MANGVPEGGGGNKVGVGIAIILLLGGAAAVLYFATKKAPETVTTVTTVTSASSVAAPAPTFELPPIDLPTDAGEDVGVDAAKPTGGGSYNPCSAKCEGSITPEIAAAVNARGNTAKQCYKSAIQDNETLSGDMKLRLKIGSNGQFCSIGVTSDTTGSPKLQQCVQQRLRVSYPQPKGGCLEVDVPINFKNKGT
jgi:hypothetical protein